MSEKISGASGWKQKVTLQSGIGHQGRDASQFSKGDALYLSGGAGLAIGFKLKQFIGKPVCQIIDITKPMCAASFSGSEDSMLQSRVLEQGDLPRYR